MATITIKNNIIAPRITEKAALAADKNCYVFDVIADSTKQEIAKEIQRLYKVTPRRVTIAKAAPKKRFFRGRFGTTKGVKKAYVYLKEGDKITVM